MIHALSTISIRKPLTGANDLTRPLNATLCNANSQRIIWASAPRFLSIGALDHLRNASTNNQQSQFKNNLHQQPMTLTKRNYIFLPSSISDISRIFTSFFNPENNNKPPSSKCRTRLVLKLRTDLATSLRARRDTFRHNRDLKMQRFRDMHSRNVLKFNALKSQNMQNFHDIKSQNVQRLRDMKSQHVQRFRDVTKSLGDSLSRRQDRFHRKVRRWQKLVVYLDPAADRDWFDGEGYPLTSRDDRGRFINPWSAEGKNNGLVPFRDFLKWKWGRLGLPFLEPCGEGRLPLVTKEKRELSDGVNLQWIGHSTCLVTMKGFRILTDPVFSVRATPVQWDRDGELGGIARYTPPALSLDDIGEDLDVVLISHDHYDHLDRNSVAEMASRGKVKVWCVPLGIKEWIVDYCGVKEDDVVEMEWWDRVTFERNESDSSLKQISRRSLSRSVENGDDDPLSNENQVTITCAPAHHWCCRSPFDRNLRLWCSFAVETAPLKFYFAGDTALPKGFPLHRQIGDRLGPFDLAALPIGAYSPSFFMKYSHCDPTESVLIHKELRSRKSVAIHWGTFAMADEPFFEPPKLLENAGREAGLEPGEFIAIRHGDLMTSDMKELNEIDVIYDLEEDLKSTVKYESI
mmetsp:Transcript_61464/g.73018  ORF Transcript_61464/g.73018 Transcript_61464/m.73018 type:complete len:631 (+) Transcript_61464:2-1894(+)|eukprot:CAMPEP_0172508452 /NCGR_PEP_ID=MMETSP1066-20121228/212100_1 /TAXON_ID=671091 /ORGANISM="Coscinodiscus wailesii, Strain CCMP2513" /LENGTH=630 /DNA_ID=CAMNT_0013286437 /DNA_START=1 /DNA_END=1893 /DNA_ORIENTATION=+